MARTAPIRTFLFLLCLAFAAFAGAQSRTIATVAGGNYFGDGQPALGAHLIVVRGVARDAAGNIYFSEPGRHAVRKIAAGTGIVTLYAGSYIIGTGGDGGPATQARFNTPGAIAAAPNGDLYIVDSGNHRVRKVAAATGIITTVAGTGIPGNGPVNGPATSAALNSPGGLVVTASGDLIIADTQNHVLRRVEPSGFITTMPLTAFRLTPFPQGIAEIGGDIYIADVGQGLIIRDSNVTGQEVMVGNPDDVPPPGSADGPALAMRLVQPQAVIPRTGRDFYTLEGGGAPKLRRYDAATATIATESMAIGNQAQAMVLESTDAVIIGESGLIRRFDTAANTNSVLAGNRTFTGDGGPATQAYVGGPQGAARGPDGHLYVSDATTNTVRRVDATTGVITRFAGGGNNTEVNGGPATSVRLSLPRALRFDAAGNLYILDANNARIRKVTPAGTVTTFAGGGSSTADGTAAAQFQLPIGMLDMAIDAQGNILVASTIGVVYRVDAATMTVTRFAGAENRSGFSGDGGPAVDAAFSLPGSVAFDAAGNAYIADSGNDRIRKVSGGIVTTYANVNLGGQAFLAVDASGALYYSRTAEDDVLRFDGNATLFAGQSGVIGNSGDGGAPTSARFFAPTFLSITPNGSLLVTDANNFRVREISPPAAQAIDFAPLPPRATNAPPFTVSATGGGSGNPVMFTSLSTPICTTSGTNGSTVTVTGTLGTCTIAANQAGNANFAAAPQVSRAFAVTTAFTVTPSQSTPNGTITPSTPQSVADGAQVDFSVVPDTDYTRLVSGTCGGSFQPDGTTFRTNPVHANCTVIAFFGIKTFVVNASKTGNGTLSPSGTQAISIHGQITYTVTPNPGHAVAMGGTCGGTLAGNSYTTNPVEADCTVTATFTPVNFTVTPSAGTGGTITPNTPQTVLQGTTKAFTIAPGPAFVIDVIGGTCGGTLSGSTYTTAPVNANCTVNVTFKDKVTTFTVTNTLASGPGSLAGTLAGLRASTCPSGKKVIAFNIPAATDPGCTPATGICVIQAPATLGVRCDDTILDGYTQPGAVPNTRTDRGNDAQIKIEIASSSAQRLQFNVQGDDQNTGNAPSIRRVTIRGIAFINTQLSLLGANTGSIRGGGGEFTVSGNWFGVHANGVAGSTNSGSSLMMLGNRLDSNQIGGPNPGDRNVFLHGAVQGDTAIQVNGVESSSFEGNFVNVGLDGTPTFVGYPYGIDMARNAVYSVGVSHTNLVKRNAVYVSDFFGSAVFANGPSNTFTENALVSRGGIFRTIQLGDSGNNLQAFPVIGTVDYTGGVVTASGTLQSAPNETFRIELFANTELRPNRFAGGERFVGAVTATSNGAGLATWSVVLPADARNLTATATRLSTGDTSEFSEQVPSQATVTPSVSGSGTITPSTPQAILIGGQVTFSVQPGPGNAFTVGGTCGGSLAGNSYTTDPVLASCTVVATFTPILHTVTPSAGTGGTISPNTPQSVAEGTTRDFTIVPGNAFVIDTVGGTCGGTLNGTTYTTAPVMADCTVSVTFKDRVTVYTVTTTQVAGNGSLSGVLADLKNSCPGGRKQVIFNIPASTDPGCTPATGICILQTPQTLRVHCDDVEIDGYTQPGSSPNTRTDLGNNAKIRIELAGAPPAVQTLEFRGEEGPFGFTSSFRKSVRGIAFPHTQLVASGGNSGSVQSDGGQFTISGNWFGFHADGTPVTTGNPGSVFLIGSRISNNRVGGPNPADRNRFTNRNVSVCCEFGGTAIAAAGVENSLFEGNFVNVDADGNPIVTNGMAGINMTTGLSQGTASTQFNLVRRNVILGVPGSAIAANGDNNTFTENMLTSQSPQVRVLNLGNHGQAVPVFGNVSYTASQVVANGTLQSAPGESFVIELFHNSQVASGLVAGAERFLGAMTIATDASGLGTWTIALPPDARNMTATATRVSTGDTSEFSVQHVSPNLRTVTPSAGANGSITPSTPQLVAQGATPSFTLAPAAGFEVDAVGGTCGGSLAGLVFTTNAVTVDCTVQAMFKATATQAPPAAQIDFDANGKADLLWRNVDGSSAIYLMDGLAIASSAQIFPAGTAWQVAHMADLNGDGKTDLVWQNPDGRVTVYLMDGTTAVTRQLILPAGGGWTVTQAADLDGDGKADLVFRNTDGTIAAWLMNGAAMTAGSTLLGAGSGWSVTKTGDFDGDGKADLLWTHTDGRVAIWLMDGLVIKSTNQILNAGTGWSVTHVTDFDGDGKSDLLWQNTDGSIAVWLMNGNVMASGSGLLGAGTGWSVTRTGDFNGDGKADLFFLHTDGRAAIYLMNGLVPVETTQILNAGGGWSAKRLQDMNGDGKADIVWENVDGSVAIWLMNGTALLSGSGILGAGTGWSVSGVSP
ncbi:hypothetical protein BWI17_18560 [Betaproteobacteria bacterium GR16-43]|nr:hypothetical protein BWI17_18560 [Betaproteobacteria bacterium GR16-43]